MLKFHRAGIGLVFFFGALGYARSQQITHRYVSPDRTIECYSTFGQDDSGTRLFIRRKGSKVQGKLLRENGRWMKVLWSPGSRFFAVEDHWDGHVCDVYVYAVTLRGNNLSLQRVAHSPALRTYNAYWEVKRWDMKHRHLIIQDKLSLRHKKWTVPFPARQTPSSASLLGEMSGKI